MEGLEYPIPYQKVPLVEEKNNIRINVYGYFEDKISILYVSNRTDDDVINLLLIGSVTNQHYVLIRNFSRFLSYRTKHNGKYFFCFHCLHGFQLEETLKKHEPTCKQHEAQIIVMPEEGKNIMQFTATHMQHKIDFCIYADFESLLVPVTTTAPSSNQSFAHHTAKHIPCGYAYIIVGPDSKTYKKVEVYRGENAVEHFLKTIIEEKEKIAEKLKTIAPLKLTPEQEAEFQKSTICCICEKTLHGIKVREHNHLDGTYRGSAHVSCNLNLKQPKKIPVIFHNLMNYDAHHIMTELGQFKDHHINVIASTLENYITFTLKKSQCPVELMFIDSYKFLPSSLEKLVANLQSGEFHILKENFDHHSNLSLLTQKQVYPYDHFDSFEKFEEKTLPPPTAFFNQLTKEAITEEEYKHAVEVWNTFKLKNLGEYHDLYVKTDVLLLADVFENFRKLCLNYYKIDAPHVVTSPGLSFQACLKMSEVELELLTDPDMLLFIENAIRGGVSQISRRFAAANNPLAPHYNEKSPNSYIMYWDANNLYGWAMSQHLPYGGFEWEDPLKFDAKTILQIKDDSRTGFIFEVDLEYPAHLHVSHNDLPLAPERVTIHEEMLSPYAKSLLKNRKFKGMAKLVPNLNPKVKYTVFYRNLKLYLQLGLKITKIHQVLKFNQAPWLRPYIQFNTNKRKEATSAFEKDFFKLLNNSIYGKCIENKRKHRNIELCITEERGMKLTASPNFKSFKIFQNDLVAVERKQTTIRMDRPIYVGFVILELSKVLMYDFHYNFIKKEYKENASLLFTDTDSLTYLIETPSIEKDMERHRSYFDFSDYPKNHPLYSEDNKKVIGKFKDELNGDQAYEFVGLKSKMYSIKSVNAEKKRAKGVSTRVVRKELKHEDYLSCLKDEKTTFALQTRIGQLNHQLFTIHQNKKCLSPFDDKRYILPDGVTSLAYGHCDITPI